LKKIELPIVDFQNCKRQAPDNFKPFLTSDKFCAGIFFSSVKLEKLLNKNPLLSNTNSRHKFLWKKYKCFNCLGYNHGTGGVCKGNSGAGIVFAKEVDEENIFHLHGIVSNTRSVDGGCDMNFYALFTLVQNHIDMIREEIVLSKTAS
jgi:modular serine protease